MGGSRVRRLPGVLGSAWRDARANNPRPDRATAQAGGPLGWGRALVYVIAATAVLWIVQVVNAATDYRADRFGMQPRELGGLWGIVTEPFLHDSYSNLASNTVPVLLAGWVLMLSGLRTWAVVTAIVILLGDAATWVAAPSGLILGASSLVFGWLGYLIARAYFSRKVRWILTAVVVLFFFGTFLGRLLPTFHAKVSWQAHLAGFLAGVAAGALLHLGELRARRRRRRKPAAGTATAAPVS